MGPLRQLELALGAAVTGTSKRLPVAHRGEESVASEEERATGLFRGPPGQRSSQYLVAIVDDQGHEPLANAFLEVLGVDAHAVDGGVILVPIEAGIDRLSGKLTVETRSVTGRTRRAGLLLVARRLALGNRHSRL